MASFTELENLIAELSDEQSRGDAFEVFAEAYPATQRKHDASKVWPLTSVPTTILQTLGLGQQDYGVDGVFQTLLGHFNAYQVKFRTSRPALTWRELSTFMGLADSSHIRSRVLFTNCDELPSVLNERQGFFCIRSLPSLAYLCVCSDATVKEGLDAIDTKQSDLDLQVSTDAASVRGFLDAPSPCSKPVVSSP